MAMTLDGRRNDFEAAMLKHGWEPNHFAVDGKGDYAYRDTAAAWKAWHVAHITQPAQAVDVGAIREVIETMREASAGRALFHNGGETGCYEAWIEKLTAAIPTSPTDKEG